MVILYDFLLVSKRALRILAIHVYARITIDNDFNMSHFRQHINS